MPRITITAPAKINLFLHITGRRSDGYHNIQTIFQLLNYGDEMSFSGNDTGRIDITTNLDSIPKQENLIFLAAKKLQHVTAGVKGCSINVRKQIPMGAGLGGGSSNAAATLIALNQLWQCGLSTEVLAKIGCDLGADVPVFVHGKSAFAEGIGELISPLELPRKWFLVVTPDCHVSTKEIFSHPQLTRNSAPIKIRALDEVQLRNDCQSVVFDQYPAVKEAFDWLKSFGQPLMTGTGSSVFCSFDRESKANGALLQLPNEWNGFVAQGINFLESNQKYT
jgi:4-diphosphocytidyl-2-C-methyl-D-erythritol kinase